MTAIDDRSTTARAFVPNAVWLELTTKCQLTCPKMCYVQAGPHGTDGRMRPADWQRVIDELAAMGLKKVRFIGGEPTMHPYFAELVNYALGQMLEVEVLTNLARKVSGRLWQVFSLPGVSLAVSYHSARAEEHDRITGRRGSHALTRAALLDVVRRGLPLRVNVVETRPGQGIAETIADLESMGISRKHIGVDVVREVGNAVSGRPNSGTDQLCGRCTGGRLAIANDGTVYPCVFAREMAVGNVLTMPLEVVIGGELLAGVIARLEGEFSRRPPHRHTKACAPDMCGPDFGCSPVSCRP